MNHRHQWLCSRKWHHLPRQKRHLVDHHFNPELPHKMHEGLWLWINFLGIKCIQLIKLLYINRKQDPYLGLTTFYTCSYAYGSHKRTPLFFFPSIARNIWWRGGGCPIKAAIEIKHKALTSEQLNGPTIIAVGVWSGSWALGSRKQWRGDHGWEQALFPFHISLLLRFPQLLCSHRIQSRYPKGLRWNLA